MYTITKNIKIVSFTLMAIGFIGLFYGFYTAPHSIEESNAIVASYGDHGHSSNHGSDSDYQNNSHHKENSHKSEGHEVSHEEHVYHQLSNRPWSALYVAALFFFLISLGTLAFYAIQRASQAGWSPILFRVMEGITGYLLPGSIIVFVILVLCTMHLNHLFVWMDPEVVAHDKIIQAKSGYLDSKFFLARAIFYLLGWNIYRFFSRKFSLAQDKANDISNHKKKLSAISWFPSLFYSH
jgi:hypothetical protein